MNVGDNFPVRQVRDRPCPKCGDKVFKMYPSGFVIESAQVVAKTHRGFNVKNNYHCPACGIWRDVIVEVTEQGFLIPKREAIVPEKTFNSSDKSKHGSSKRT